MKSSADAYEGTDLFISTVKGRKFYAARPVFDIEEIAHALSMQCRYTGHVRTFYSVAEHSVIVSRLCEDFKICQAANSDKGPYNTPQFAAFEGLMHDAHEAYISDFASPWKCLVPQYRPIEARFESALRTQFDLPAHISYGVKLADWFALFLEAEELMPPIVSEEFPVPNEKFKSQLRPIREAYAYQPEGWDWRTAKREFLRRHSSLNAMRGGV